MTVFSPSLLVLIVPLPFRFCWIPERLTAAVSEREKEVRDSIGQEWNARELEWSNNFDVECDKRVNSMAVDSQNSLGGFLPADRPRPGHDGRTELQR